MPALTSLPTELITDIFSSLRPRDLQAVSLVCQKFHAIASTHLYTSPYLTAYYYPFPRPLHIFLQTILSRPTLAAHVRFLRMKWGNGRHSPIEILPEDSSVAVLFTAAAARIGLIQTMTFEGAHILLLLHLLPQLHHLSLNFNFLNDGIIHDFLSLQGQVRPAHLSPGEFSRTALPIGLQVVREIIYEDVWTLTSSLSLIGLFTLPAVRKIHLRMRDNLRDDEDIADWQKGRSGVTDFTFDGDVVPESLAGLLAIPRALTHFTYIEPANSYQQFDCAAFGRAILPTRETLQSLSVYIDNWPGVRLCSGQKDQTIGSLRDWPVLKCVRCPVALLLGMDKDGGCSLVDVLPRVLSEFTVGMDWHWDDKDIVTRLLDLLGRHEHLVRLTLEILIQERLAIVLRDACDAARVQLEIVMPEGDQEM